MAYEIVIIPKAGRLRLSLLNVIQVGRAISAFKGLELYDGKLSRTVLRGRKAPSYPVRLFVALKREKEMNGNVYQPPISEVTIERESKITPTKAIFWGMFVSTLGTMVVAVIIGVCAGVYGSAIGMSTEEIDSLSNNSVPVLLAFIVEAFIFSFWSGHYVAKKTKYSEYKFCFIMIGIGCLLSIVFGFFFPDVYGESPDWYMYVSYVTYPVAILSGCWLKVSSKK